VKYDKNEFIQAAEVRLIDDEGENVGVISRNDALEKARSLGLDLVLISPNENPPVARIIEWSKFKYSIEKKSRNKGKSVESKEWRFNASIAKRDTENKLKYIEKFLKKGGRVKIIVRGRRKQTREMISDTMKLVLDLSVDFSEKVGEVSSEGNNMSVFIKYKKDEKQNAHTQSDS
jgi:translation initiation factor IF-3